MMTLLWLMIPLGFALLRLQTGKYIFSALVSLSCAAIALGRGTPVMALGLAVSAIGDWLLAHTGGKEERFLWGVGAFGMAHIIFITCAAARFVFSPAAAAFVAALTGFYCVYLIGRVLPGQAAAMRCAVLMYALVSLCGLFFALCMGAPMAEKLLYIAGIGAIVFSDTMIAEARFAGQQKAQKLILPTYYLCHILLAASALIEAV